MNLKPLILKILKEEGSKQYQIDDKEKKRLVSLGFPYPLHDYIGILKQHGYDIKEYLGEGMCGKAYALSNGKVLKVTDDRKEANACEIIRGKTLKNVYKIFDVFEFESDSLQWDVEWYGIVQERLQKIENSDMSIAVIEQFKNARTIYPIDKRIEVIRDRLEINSINLNKENIKLIYDLSNGQEELKHFGIDFKDYHSGNIMKRKNGDYVIIDLGLSESPHAKIKRLGVEDV